MTGRPVAATAAATFILAAALASADVDNAQPIAHSAGERGRTEAAEEQEA